MNDDNTRAEVVSVKIEIKPLKAFNLTVADYHTYFVAENDEADAVWVHNSCYHSVPEGYNPIAQKTEYGQDQWKNANGDVVYRGHDGKFYDLVHTPTPKPVAEVPNKLTTAQRIAKLDVEGHAPIRHGGPNRVTDLQLEDRAVRGIDPASGTTFDAFNKFPDGSPKPHKVGRNATAFTSDDALLQADDFARSSTQFQQNIATARANGDIFVDPVEIPLKDAFGNNYQEYVRGVTRLGSKNNPTGHVPTDFTDGTLKAIYRLDQNGNVKLHTLYPNPKP